MNYELLYVVFILVAIWFVCFKRSENYINPIDPDCNSSKNIFYEYPKYYDGPLKRNALDFPNYPLPMPDRYEFGRMFVSDEPTISYKPGYW
jgi:hypothetical protein